MRPTLFRYCILLYCIIYSLSTQAVQQPILKPEISEWNHSKDYRLKDDLGNEYYFRGFNVSGKVKHRSSGFKPFINQVDAEKSLSKLKINTGSNIIRFTIAWEGTHPAVDTIDIQYLDDVIQQIKIAIHHGFWVLLDYHSDLYSRHTFTPTSHNTGNGAPKWIIEGGNHGQDRCGLPCAITWSAHKLYDESVRSAMRSFWLNSPIMTTNGVRYVQSEFLWQLEKTLAYLNKKLSTDELSHIIGLDPINEPFDGGLQALGIDSYRDFDNQLLWPFYQRVRSLMNLTLWRNQFVFAEPIVFWHSLAGVVAQATGGHYLNQPPGKGFIFNSHFYDQGRQGIANLSIARNGAYFNSFNTIRKEAHFLRIPLFLSEFGMWVHGTGSQDSHRIINNIYQSLESGQQKIGPTRRLDFYMPYISATQWHWDYYYDQHHELQNSNPNLLRTNADGWNKENYSVIKNYAQAYTVAASLIERAYPQIITGQLYNFTYAAQTIDKSNQPLLWHGICDNQLNPKHAWIPKSPFLSMSWDEKNLMTKTQIYLPRNFSPKNSQVYLNGQKYHPDFSVRWMKDNPQSLGYQLAIHSKKNGLTHLIVFSSQSANTNDWAALAAEQALNQTNPICLTGSMTRKDRYNAIIELID